LAEDYREVIYEDKLKIGKKPVLRVFWKAHFKKLQSSLLKLIISVIVTHLFGA
jgi:hypothetical protein